MNQQAEMLRAIRQEVARQLNILLSGQAGVNTAEKETIDNLYPGSPSIKDRPVMHPFGFVSRAPRGTLSVTGRQGAGPENRLVLGHRDSKRPADVDEGEAVLYASDGKTVLSRLTAKKDGSLAFQTGSGGASKGGLDATLTADGKAAVTNKTGELIGAIIDCLTEIGNATTLTQLGNQALIMPNFPAKLQVATSFKK
jgi:phage gp45-like